MVRVNTHLVYGLDGCKLYLNS